MRAAPHRVGHGAPGRRRGGHTLIEVLVSLGIFAFLGSALIAFLNRGVSIWHLAENRGRIYERARAVLDVVAEDLRSVASDVRPEGTGFWVRIVCDRDPRARQRLRFVRALAGELSDPVARHGGEYLARADSGYYDHRGDLAESEEGRVLAPAGYQEVLYACDPDPDANLIWRGVRSPVGGMGSLFIDVNIEPEAKAKRAAAGRRGGVKGGGAEKESESERSRRALERVARPLAGDVLYLGFRFWTPGTNTWDESVPPLRVGGSRPSGPTSFWDSTRALLETTGKADQFTWDRVEGSIDDPRDDIFPERVEVTLVLAGNPELGEIRLTRAISSSDKTIPLSSTVGLPVAGPFRHVRIGSEWIRYESIDGDRLDLGSWGARGARGTEPAKHDTGETVVLGSSFRRVVEIPAHRTPLEALPEARGGLGRRRGR